MTRTWCSGWSPSPTGHCYAARRTRPTRRRRSLKPYTRGSSPDPVRPDELLLDAARGITRWAVAHQLLPESALDEARRPYGLKPPGPPPTEKTLDAKYGWREGQPDDESYSAIHSSVLSMGDFGRYVVESGMHNFSRYRFGQEYPETPTTRAAAHQEQVEAGSLPR